MIIDLHHRDGLATHELESLTERKVRFALSRFESHIAQVEIVLSDENGPRGGCDKICRITVLLRDGTPVIVRHLDESFERGISMAVERVQRVVARRVDRKRAHSRVRGATTTADGLDGWSRTAALN